MPGTPQVESSAVWREVVRDGARAGGLEAGPNPQPLAVRLSGLPSVPAQRSVDESEPPDEKRRGGATTRAVTKKLDSQEKAEDLTLDEEVGKDNGTPTRGPPKTPKRNKGSSPQLANVSVQCVALCPCLVGYSFA